MKATASVILAECSGGAAVGVPLISTIVRLAIV
jgi:hypothetical protein